ncbi:MAG: hypothetical protein IT204_06780 [Fimbriimonadaceae bacterium]|nr:hypothetical protein [Fimbriimonadaceae bacterium]
MPALTDLPPDFPPLLRALLAAELAAGNALAAIGAGFPAPPVGCVIDLAEPLRTSLPAGLLRRERQSSRCSSEITDAAAVCFVLEPPRPIPWPDPDAIRTSQQPPPPPPAVAEPRGRLVVDRRGELLTWHQDGRVTTVICTGVDPAMVACQTLTDWWDPQRRCTTAMAVTERTAVLRRIVAACRSQGGFAAEPDEDLSER